MARGRKSKGAGEVFAVRLDEDLRSQLQRAADENSHPLSEEIRQRLRRSTKEDQKICDRFGDPRSYAFFRLLNLAVLTVANYGTDKPARRKFWLDDRAQYLKAATALRVLLRTFEPKGKLSGMKVWEAEGEGIVAAGIVLQVLRDNWTAESQPLRQVLESRYGPDVMEGISQELAKYLDRSPGKVLIDEMQRRYVEGEKP